jgi:hypothetical protein
MTLRPTRRSFEAPLSLRLCLVAFFLLAAAFGAGDAGAIPICGDGFCAGSPFETPDSCPIDCGGPPPSCGDGSCNGSETCDTCLKDCVNRCITLTLVDELKKNSCTNDDDNDCLDNFREQDLAWIFSPHYFYDEGEDCAGAWYTNDPDTLHFGRRDFFQVRPKGNPAGWTTTGNRKNLTLTYYLLHPRDCQGSFISGGHQGDSESVVFHLGSYDLRRWSLTKANYRHHGRTHTFSGEYLKARANEIGTIYPSVAADEDGHGSWPGKSGSSSDCAGPEDDFCTLGTCDCFRGTMKQAKDAGYREYLRADKNIGGPEPERFRSSVVQVLPAQVALSELSVGHGLNFEFWTPRSDGFKKFCGWECPLRDSDGDCVVSAHGRNDCTSPLSEKVASASFTPIPSSLAATEPEPVVYDAEESARLAAEVHVLLNGLSHLPTATLDGIQARLAEAADPIGEVAPMVAGRSRAEQLRTLEWALAEAPDKLEAAVAPDLLPGDGLTPKEIESASAELVGGLAGLLRAAGHAGGK